MRFAVDPWDPSYGISNDAEGNEEAATVGLETERSLAEWAPVSPRVVPSGRPIAFVDGVRRVEARLWIEGGDGMVPGVCASWAAGVVCCTAETASVPWEAVEVGRTLAAPVPLELLEPVVTRHARYLPAPARGPKPEDLWLAVQHEMGSAEGRVARVVLEARPDALIVVDGPLPATDLRGDVAGLIKSHHVRYLPEGPAGRTLAELEPGQRTPLFTIGSGGFARHSWYVKLPGDASAIVPLAGVVRCEVAVARTGESLVRFADELTAELPRFASSAHKDRRAPQNLTPIAGLERRLRHLLGDPAVLYRSLRQAATRN